MSSLVLIEAGIKDAGMASPSLNNKNDTLLEGISRTIEYLENQTTKEIRTGICLTREREREICLFASNLFNKLPLKTQKKNNNFTF